MTVGKYEYFWGGPFSQWYRSEMQIDGVTFNCCEQYMMYMKAVWFNDIEISNKILETTNPKDQKELGRKVRGFDTQLWDSVCFQIVYRGNYHKFTQNEELKSVLLKTGNKILVEASPQDKIWGVGLHESDYLINDPMNWKGKNLLGWALMLVRQELIDLEPQKQ